MPAYAQQDAIAQKSPFACGAACAVFITRALGLQQLDKVSTAMKSTSTAGMVECLGSTPWLVARYVKQKLPNAKVFRFTEAKPVAHGGLTYFKCGLGSMKADLLKHVPQTESQYRQGDVILRMWTPDAWAVTSHFVVETRFVRSDDSAGSMKRVGRTQIMNPMHGGTHHADFTEHDSYDDYLQAISVQRTGLDLLFRK
jgi:hypothetical protein